MSRPSHNWDVWFVAADQVYRNVPTDVCAGWASQGRLAATDRLRPAGTNDPWRPAADVPGVGGFLSRAPAPAEAYDDPAAADVDLGPPPARKVAEDDEVDMIPLIDISLVLLVFFMMTATVAALPSVDVPPMKYAPELAPEKTALVVQVAPKPGGSGHLFSLRAGDRPADPGDADLPTPAELLARLDARLAGLDRPPMVRIAAERGLPTEVLMLDIAPELERRRKAGKITSYAPDVQEQK